jgi:hypothetical protein
MVTTYLNKKVSTPADFTLVFLPTNPIKKSVLDKHNLFEKIPSYQSYLRNDFELK